MPGLANPGSFTMEKVLHSQMATYPEMVFDHLLWSGDREFARRLWPSALRIARHLMATNLMSLESGDFITDCPTTDASWWSSRGVLLMVCARGLERAASLGAFLGDMAGSSECRTGAEILRTLVLEKFFDPATGRFSDDPEGTTFSHHAAIHAVLAEIATGKDARRVLLPLDFAPGARIPISGGSQFHWIDSLFRAGLAEQALEVIRRYGAPQIARGQTTFMDLFDPRDPETRLPEGHALSYCHGWSGGAAYLLPAFAAGLRPVGLGRDTLVFQPQLGSLRWIRTRLPFRGGFIEAEIEGASDGQVRANVSLPSSLRLDILPPEPGAPSPSVEIATTDIP
jgi:hypothetical protein